MRQRSQLDAIVNYKCPRCRKGDMFQHPISRISKFDKMYKHCPNCNVHFEQEPGFYFGAMYISYAFSVAIFVVMALILYIVFGDPELWVYMVVVPFSVLLLLPLIFRLSRSIFLHLFGGIVYDPEYAYKSE